MKKYLCIATCAFALIASQANAQVLDGSRTGDAYGSARAVQTVQTGFGDNASELNAAFGTAKISDGMLRLILTGQVESNFNKLNIFVDSVAGGQNVIGADDLNGGVNSAANSDGLFENYSGVGASASGNGPGFTFDAGFEADYVFIARNGDAGGDRFDFNFLSVGNASVAEESLDIFGGSLTGTNAAVGASGIGVGYDNSNTLGVGAGSGAADQTAALAVQTGLELFIPLSAIGSPGLGDTILISAHINGSNHDYLSNQSLGGFRAPQGNPGGDNSGGFNNDVSLIDLNTYAGNQYFSITVVPEPSTFAVLGLSAFGLVIRRKRR